MARPQRVAVIEVHHWHASYDASYLRILKELGLNIVGVSDSNSAIAEDLAKRFDSTAFTDYREMIEKTRPEFVIALGRHVDMPEIFRYMVNTRIPFIMEKPWGVDAATVNQLADLAESEGAWVGVPYMTRYSHWAETAKEMIARGEFGAVSHVVFRMIRPTVHRYQVWGSPWMLDRAVAGGGALLNLGSHGLDIAHFITGEEVSVVSAVISNAVNKLDVEEYAMVTLRSPSGIIFHVEVGYTMPTWPENTTDTERKVAGEKALLREVPGGVQLIAPGRNEIIKTPGGYVGGYPRVVAECLDRIANGQPPAITARDCARAVSLIHEAYRAAGRR